MLINTKELYGRKLAAKDGEIGHVRDLYFDDTSWAARYVVVDAGTWLEGRLVLLSPHAFGRIEPDGVRNVVALPPELQLPSQNAWLI